MNNQDNPYMNLVEVFNKMNDNQCFFKLGNVVSINPFLVNVDGIQLERNDLLINDVLLAQSKRKVKIIASEVTGNLDTEYGGNLSSFNMNKGIIENLEDCFSPGDNIVMLADTKKNQFILICKVR